MWPESSEAPKALRSGLTTGSCATACCVAAAQYLFTQRQEPEVQVTLPKGQEVSLNIIQYQPFLQGCKTATIKDAGDDPDVTHGATVFVELSLVPEKGVRFFAAQGVGTVTRTGLLLPVGEPAINPVPRNMMTEHLQDFARLHHYQGGFNVAVGVEQGEQIAQKTMNPRLGITGGLSILGTTGIVRPFSCAAYIASIHQGIDVARANSITHIAATTGNASEAAIKAYYQLEDMAFIEMGDFVGAVLKHLKKVESADPKLTKLSICGGFGKMTKLAEKNMDLNSRASSINLTALADLAVTLGASSQVWKAMNQANTSVEALSIFQQNHADLKANALANEVCQKAANFCRTKLPASLELEVMAIDRTGKLIGYARG
ncbi:cobalt-precorrin-5B (C(1))-methyltransferase [Marinomonas epiphytica]